MSPMARLNGSAFLGVDLQPCKTMTDTLAPVERANWGVTSLEFYPRPEWCPFGLVEWSRPSGGDWWPRVFTRFSQRRSHINFYLCEYLSLCMFFGIVMTHIHDINSNLLLHYRY